MRTFHFIIILFLVYAQNSAGQNEKAAIIILDKFSSNALGAPSVSMVFDLVTSDLAENNTDTLSGSLILSNNKYKLDLTDNIIWFDGDVAWSYLPAEKEVTITKADKKDNSFQSRPSAIFSLYKNGYKSRLIDERPESYIIDLYPEDIKSDLLRVRLSINKPELSLRSLEYKKRDGIIITLYISEYNLKLKTDPGTFTFKPENYKGVEVIDMR